MHKAKISDFLYWPGILLTTCLLIQPALGKSFKVASLKDFSACANSFYAEDCLRELDTFLAKNPSQTFEAGKLVRLHFNAAHALPYFSAAVKKGVPVGFCDNADVALALDAGLFLPNDYPNAKLARQLFADTCFSQSVGRVQKILSEEPGNVYLKGNVCPIFGAKKVEAAACGPVASVPPPPAQVQPGFSAVPDKATMKIGKLMVFNGRQGETVTMGAVEGSDAFLVRFEGVEGVWNDRTILLRRVTKGGEDADYWTEYGGRRWVAITQRWRTQAYIPGDPNSNGLDLSFSAPATKKASKVTLLDGYQP